MVIRQTTYLRLVLVLVYLTALAWVGRGILTHPGFPLDDSWIHQSVARTLVDHGSSSGTSSPLWTFLLSLNQLFGAPINPVYFSLFINTVALLLFGQLLFLAAKSDGFGNIESIAISLLPALSGNFIWLCFTGMEFTLFCTLSLAAIYFSLTPTVNRRTVHCLAISGCAVLLRPEGILISAVLCLSLLIRTTPGVSKQPILFSLLGSVLGSAMYLIFNSVTAGSPLPATIEGRRWLYGFSGTPDWSAFQRYMISWTEHIRNYTLNGYSLTLTLVLLLALAGISVLIAGKRLRLLVVTSFAILLFIFYGLYLPSIGHGGRYQPLSLAVIWPLTFIGLSRMAVWIPHLITRHTLTAIQGVLIAVLLLPSLNRWSEITSAGIAHINGTHRRMGIWIKKNLPADARIASFDIGGVDYFSGRSIVDLGGLKDSKYLPYLYSGIAWEYMKEHRIRYVVLPMWYDDWNPSWNLGLRLNITQNPNLTLEPVKSFATPYSTWVKAAYSTGHASPRQALYRVWYND